METTFQTEESQREELLTGSPMQEIEMKFEENGTPEKEGNENTRKRVDYLDVSNEDFSKYEVLDVDGNKASPSKFSIF